MALTGRQREQLHRALRSAFTRDDLAMLVDFRLDGRLGDFSSPDDDDRALVYKLIEWAERRGRLTKLVAEALDMNPDSEELQAFNEQIWQPHVVNAGRRIVTTPAEVGGSVEAVDTPYTTFLKLFPSESAITWTVMTLTVEGSEATSLGLLILMLFVMEIITFLLVIFQTSLPGEKPNFFQAFLSAIGLLVWAYALGGPFRIMGIYNPNVGVIALLVYMMLIPIVYPKLSR